MSKNNQPQISVITPTNSEKWFHLARASLMAQTFQDWEWVVLLNGEVTDMRDTDPRIKIVRSSFNSAFVGMLKREACLHATAPFVLEFDHDDELHVEALELVVAEFAKGADFVYSDCAQVNADGKPFLFYPQHGWEISPQDFTGPRGTEKVIAHKCPPILPQNISRIWYAPDHLRSWRASIYWAVGGHDATKSVLDDLDIMQKIYLARGRFRHIARCLYRYSVHGQNTYLQRNVAIQTGTLEMHDARIYDISLAGWSGEKSCVDLGGGINSPKGWISCDRHNANITADLEQAWPFKDDSVGAFRAHDFIEHLRDPIHTMNEAWRSLCHGGLLLIEVPSTDGRGAFQDPTHVSFWNANSFFYWTRAVTQKYIEHAGAKARFQVVRMVDYFPSDWHKTHNIPYVRAHLAAIKDGPRLHGLMEF